MTIDSQLNSFREKTLDMSSINKVMYVGIFWRRKNFYGSPVNKTPFRVLGPQTFPTWITGVLTKLYFSNFETLYCFSGEDFSNEDGI